MLFCAAGRTARGLTRENLLPGAWRRVSLATRIPAVAARDWRTLAEQEGGTTSEDHYEFLAARPHFLHQDLPPCPALSSAAASGGLTTSPPSSSATATAGASRRPASAPGHSACPGVPGVPTG